MRLLSTPVADRADVSDFSWTIRPQHAIDMLRRDARRARAPEHRELMAQREILKRQLSLNDRLV